MLERLGFTLRARGKHYSISNRGPTLSYLCFMRIMAARVEDGLERRITSEAKGPVTMWLQESRFEIPVL